MLKKFFVSSCDGALYDTAAPNWAAVPLRPVYQKTFSRINSTQEFKATIRAGEFAWPGGYQMLFVTSDGAPICFKCARKNSRSVFWSIKNNCSDGWKIIATEINYEDENCHCDNCGNEIPAAYSVKA